MGWFDEGGGGSPVDVAAMFDGKAWEMATEMVSAGALISVGLTSDGGALGLTVTLVWLYLEILRLLSYLQND